MIFDRIVSMPILRCDYCEKSFPAPLTELPADFDPKTASAICPECGDLLKDLIRHPRDYNSKLYREFVEKCAKSVARKLGYAN